MGTSWNGKQLSHDMKNKTPANILAEWRKVNGLSQSEAAKRFGVSPRTWQGWEGGRSTGSSYLRMVIDRIHENQHRVDRRRYL